MGRGRTEAFSDGVFTIAATLLVLGIPVPHVAEGELLNALLNRWPDYFAYAVSFIVIGNMWVSHHQLFHILGRIDRPLLYINLMLLLFVALLPFPTAVLAASFGQERNLHVAAAFYSIEMLCISLSFGSIWGWSTHARLIGDGRPLERGFLAALRLSLGTIVWVVSIPLAFVSVYFCMAIWALTLVYYMLVDLKTVVPQQPVAQ